MLHVAAGHAVDDPVGHDQSVEAPLPAQDHLEQLGRLGGVDAVDEVVGSHDGGGAGLAHADLEGAQVEVAQGSGADPTVGVEAIGLLVVAGQMFDGHAPSRMGLDPAGDGGGEASGQQRVLGEVLEVASAQDAAVQVEGGGEPEVDAEALHLGPDDVAEPLGQRRVPGLGERGADGDGGGVLLADLGGFAGLWLVGDAEGLTSGVVHELEEGGGQAGVAQGEGALGVDAVGGGQAQAGGPVGHDDAGQAGDPGGGLARRADDGGGGGPDDGAGLLAAAVVPQDGIHELVVGEPPGQAEGLPDVLERSLLVGLGVVRQTQVGWVDGEHRQAGQDVEGRRRLGLPVGEAGLPQVTGQVSHGCVLGELDDGNGAQLPAGGSRPQQVAAGLQDRGTGGLVVGGQVGQIDVDGDPCRGAGGDLVGLREAGQRLEGLVEASGRHAGVDLDGLLAREAAGVGDVDVDAHAGAVEAHLAGLHVEGRVAQAESEGEERLLAGRVVEAVADVDALAVVGVVRVAEVADLVVLVPGGPGGGELPGGVGPAQEDVGEGVAGGRAELGEQEDVGNVVERAEVDDAAHVEHEEEALEALVEGEDVTDLCVGETEVSGLGGAVAAFPGGSGQDVNGCVRVGTGRDIEGDRVLRLGHDRAHADHDGGEAALGGLGPDVGDEVLMGPQTDTVVGLQPGPGDDGEAGCFQALLDGGDVAGVDVSAAGSALDGVPRTGAEQGDLARLSQGEGAVGAQQHHALGGESADGGQVVGLVGFHIAISSCHADGSATCRPPH